MTNIRTACDEDAEFIYALLCELENEQLDKNAFQYTFRTNLMAPTIYYFIAENQNQPVGFLSMHLQLLLHHCGWVAEIQELIVSTAQRSQKAGARLLAHAEQVARENQCKILEVTCNQKRQRAHRFYLSHGMHATHFKFVKELQAAQAP